MPGNVRIDRFDRTRSGAFDPTNGSTSPYWHSDAYRIAPPRNESLLRFVLRHYFAPAVKAVGGRLLDSPQAAYRGLNV